MLSLVPHPDFASVAVTAIRVDAGRSPGGQLSLRYRVEGDLDGVIWPSFDSLADRADGLWKHSCFEAFVGFVDDPAYCELNFAAARWAAYRFDDYRAGMRDIENIEKYGRWAPRAGEADWQVLLPDLDRPRDWCLGLSVIIEGKDGSKSYWALAHGAGPPDFHNPDCFIARLPPPRQT